MDQTDDYLIGCFKSLTDDYTRLHTSGDGAPDLTWREQWAKDFKKAAKRHRSELVKSVSILHLLKQFSFENGVPFVFVFQ